MLAKFAVFSWRYIPHNAALLWRELALRPQKFTAMNQFALAPVLLPHLSF